MKRKALLKWIEIDREALRANLRVVRSLLAGSAELLAVVKADAYGHGAAQVGALALAEGAYGLGVLSVREALELRAAGVQGRIVLLAPPLPEEAAEVSRARLEATVDTPELARALAQAARRPLPVHVDIDYGLGRWGVLPKRAPDILARIRKNGRLRLAGISAHLDYVPGKNAVEAEDKLRRFSRMTTEVREAVPGLLRHCANSSILVDFPHWRMDMVRVGNLIYGIDRTKSGLPLKDPWTLKARIISVQTLSKGRSLGYASEYLVPRRMTVAALPVGYADGLTMEPAERFIGFGKEFRYWGLLWGRKVPFVGRCGISHVLVDVSSVPGAKPGDVVALPIRRTAASPRIPRIYI